MDSHRQKLYDQPSPGLRHSYSTGHIANGKIKTQHTITSDVPIHYEPVMLKSSHSKQLLHGRLWRAQTLDNQPAQGVVSIVHGMGEHSGCYDTLAHQLTQQHFNVICIDHRGHGLSQGGRGELVHYDQLHQDVRDHLAFAKASFPKQPISLYAHSMGGGLVLDHLHRFANDKHLQDLQKIIVTSPWIRLKTPYAPLASAIVWAMLKSNYNPVFSMGQALKPNPNRIPTQDPLCQGKISARWFLGAEDAGSRTMRQAHTLPSTISDKLTLIHCADDGLTNPKTTQAFANKTNTHFIGMKNMGHSPHVTHQRSAFFDIITHLLPSKPALITQPRSAQEIEPNVTHP